MQATKKSVHSHEWWFLGHNSFKGWSYLHANKIHLVFHARRLNKWAITHTFTHTRTSTNLPIFIYMFVVLNTCVALVYVHWKQHKKKQIDISTASIFCRLVCRLMVAKRTTYLRNLSKKYLAVDSITRNPKTLLGLKSSTGVSFDTANVLFK